MTKPEKSRPATLYGLVVAMVSQGLTGVAGGFGLVQDPSGSALGIPLKWLAGSPFADFLIPGLVLFTVLGVVPLVTAYGLWRACSWSWWASVLVGLALFVWLGVEIAVIGYVAEPPLQLVYGALGALILALAWTPGVRGDLRP